MSLSPNFSAFSGPSGKPTEAEKRLIEASIAGDIADCTDLTGDARIVSAQLIVAIATGKFRHSDWSDWELNPIGIRVEKALIPNRIVLRERTIPASINFIGCELRDGIDLEYAALDGNLYLRDCTVNGEFNLNSAVIAGLINADNSTFNNPGMDAVRANDLRADSWAMDGATVKGCFNIFRASLEHSFNADRATFENPGGDAVLAHRLRAISWLMSNATIVGRFVIAGASLEQEFVAQHSTFDNGSGDAIFAHTIQSKNWFIDNATVTGDCDIRYAQLTGVFNATEAVFENAEGNAISASDMHAHGFDISRAKLSGRLSISGAKFSGEVRADETVFEKIKGDAITAQSVHALHWIMDGAKVKNSVDISGAKLEHNFSADNATFESVRADDAFVAHDIQANNFSVTGATLNMQFDIRGGRLEGDFYAYGTKLNNPAGKAVNASNVRAVNWLMNNAVVTGLFDISAARILEQFNADNAKFEGIDHGDDDTVTFNAANVRANNWHMTAVQLKGGLDLTKAKLEGTFIGDMANISNISGAALLAPSSSITGGVFLQRGEFDGGLDLSGTTIEKTLNCSGSTFRPCRYLAVRLTQAVIRGETKFEGATILGHIDANRTHFAGLTRFDKIEQLAAGSYARATGLMPSEIGGIAYLDERERNYQHHALILSEAKIEGRLVLPDTPPKGIVDLSHAYCETLEDYMSGWPPPIARPKRRQKKSDSSTRLTAKTQDGPEIDIQHIVLDGFQYELFEHPDGASTLGKTPRATDVADARITWLSGQSVGDLQRQFNPQPWRQAAAVLREMGYDEAAQSLTIERRIRQRLADDTPRSRRFMSSFLHAVADYGFNPWKTIRISAYIVLACAVFYSGAARYCGVEGQDKTAHTACSGEPLFVRTKFDGFEETTRKTAYPAFNAFMFSLGTFVPLFDLGTESYWRANDAAWIEIQLSSSTPENPAPSLPLPLGTLFYWLSVIERLAGAVLVAITVTGFTGFLTRDER